ncbi:MAG: hypothetical protein JW955_05735, partial [Sedimentisphaerales bacterium]|nr:hypothetical protein [Sedimentisphaerales bacterium]
VKACHTKRFSPKTPYRASPIYLKCALALLLEPTDARMLEAGRKLLVPSPEDHLRQVQNLDDAYEMAHDLESSETNTIFRFFITEFLPDKRIVTAILHHLSEHVERLMTGLPAPYTTREQRFLLNAMRST